MKDFWKKFKAVFKKVEPIAEVLAPNQKVADILHKAAEIEQTEEMIEEKVKEIVKKKKWTQN